MGRAKDVSATFSIPLSVEILRTRLKEINNSVDKAVGIAIVDLLNQCYNSSVSCLTQPFFIHPSVPLGTLLLF